MRVCSLVLIALALVATGCTSQSLQRNTVKQIETIADVRYEEALNNLAMLDVSPWSLPSYSSIFSGTTKVLDQSTISPTGNIGQDVLSMSPVKLGVTHFQTGSLDVPSQRQVSDTWSLDPVTEPEKLRAMRGLCVWVLHGQQAVSPEDARLMGPKPSCTTTGAMTGGVPNYGSVVLTEVSLSAAAAAGVPASVLQKLTSVLNKEYTRSELAKSVNRLITADEAVHYLAEILYQAGTPSLDPYAGYYFDLIADLQKLPSCWLQRGRLSEVPRNAKYKARYQDHWVWVTDDGMTGLSGFTLITQKLARLTMASAYYPPATTRTINYTDANGNIVAVAVDDQGRLLGGTGKYALPTKQRQGTAASDPGLRSQINAAVSH